MDRSAYVIGALDALVKAGEISPAYADGVRDALTKEAWIVPVAAGLAGALGLGAAGTALFKDSPQVNYDEELENYPRGYRFTPAEGAEIIDRSRHWWDYYPQWGWAYAKNRARKALNAIDVASARKGDTYDKEWENWKSHDREAYRLREIDNGMEELRLRANAAAAEHHNLTQNDYWTDTQRYKSPAERRAAGIPEKPRNVTYSPAARAAIASGLYKPTRNFDAPKPMHRVWGAGFGDRYGSSRELYSRQEVGR